MKQAILNYSLMNFCIYGLGTTGKSVLNFFKKKNFSKFDFWDDNIKNKKKQKKFSKKLDQTDFIILSPGISLNKAKLKKKLIKNKNKIITDLDLFYLLNPEIKSIVITGTNGKSTTCKILEHMLKKNNINVVLGGNIGKPVLDLNLKDKPIVIIEASSFQLSYSKFIKPDYAVILNISNDHIDWHGSLKNYVNSKFKIFSNQNCNNFAFLNDKKLIEKFKKEKYESKINYVSLKNYISIKHRIKNNYLNLEANIENMGYVYALSKILKINQKSFINSFQSFKGLNHRYEIFLKKKNKIFINDSKATSFEATRYALINNKNIYWIVGGLPKSGDKLKLGSVKNNIIKAYVIGKHMKFFKKQLKGKVDLKLCKTLENSILDISRETKNILNKKIVILLSPAGASYDQFKNFEDRGNKFKKLSKIYANKNF